MEAYQSHQHQSPSLEVNNRNTAFIWVLLSREPTSTQLISTSTQLHPPPTSSFQPSPSSLQHPQQYFNQNVARHWAISPNLDQKNKSCLFWLKIGTWYIGGVDSESRFLKFRPQNPFLGKFGPTNSKLSLLSENWYIWYLKDTDSYSNISFLNFKL